MLYGKTSVIIKRNYHSPEIDYVIDGYNGIICDDEKIFIKEIESLYLNRISLNIYLKILLNTHLKI